MSRKIIAVVFLFAIVIVSAVPTPAAAFQAYTAWTGSGPGTINFSNVAGPDQTFTYSYSPSFSGTWDFHSTADRTGSVQLDYDYTGFHSWFQVTVFLRAYVTHLGVTTYYPLVSAGPVNCCSSPSNGFSYTDSVTLNVQQGDKYGFVFGGTHFDGTMLLNGTLTVKSSGVVVYQPEIKYTMWLLTRNDGTACLLKSATHPSVNAQNAFCFPEETGRTWVADNVACSGPVDENDFWSCAAEYGQWLGLNK